MANLNLVKSISPNVESRIKDIKQISREESKDIKDPHDKRDLKIATKNRIDSIREEARKLALNRRKQELDRREFQKKLEDKKKAFEKSRNK